MSGGQALRSCRTSNLNPPCLTSRRSQPPLALSVPLSRFASQVGGGSAFYVRPISHVPLISKRVAGLVASAGFSIPSIRDSGADCVLVFHETV